MPFSEQQFLDVFGAYNRQFWIIEAVLWLWSVAVVVRLARRRTAGRSILLCLAVQWLWVGGVYHLAFFSEINPVARLFGGLFLVQGALLALQLRSARSSFRWGRAPRQLASMAIVLYGLSYPALVLLTGFRWPALPLFAVPCPTTLLTLGFLIALEPGHARYLGIIPILWACIAASAAVSFGVLPDLLLLPAALLLLLFLLSPRAKAWRAA